MLLSAMCGRSISQTCCTDRASTSPVCSGTSAGSPSASSGGANRAMTESRPHEGWRGGSFFRCHHGPRRHLIRQLIAVAAPRERVILVAAPRKGSADALKMEEHLDELGRLVDTAGADVLCFLTPH